MCILQAFYVDMRILCRLYQPHPIRFQNRILVSTDLETLYFPLDRSLEKTHFRLQIIFDPIVRN